MKIASYTLKSSGTKGDSGQKYNELLKDSLGAHEVTKYYSFGENKSRAFFVTVDHRAENYSSYLNFGYITVDKWMEESLPKKIQKTWNENFKGPKVEEINRFKKEFGEISWKY